MKVILIKDVARLGRKGTAHEVPDGHAQNFLIPRKLAVTATPVNMKRLEAEEKRQGENHEKSLELFKEALATLGTTPVVYEAPASAQGHLFKGVNEQDIEAVLKKAGVSLTKDDILLPHPIKDVGTHEIKVARGGREGSFTLEVKKQ